MEHDPQSDGGPPPHDIEEVMVEIAAWFVICTLIFAGFKIGGLI
jgi:hypothetical protein